MNSYLVGFFSSSGSSTCVCVVFSGAPPPRQQFIFLVGEGKQEGKKQASSQRFKLI